MILAYLTLITADGCVGAQQLTRQHPNVGSPFMWAGDPTEETTLAIFSRVDSITGDVIEVCQLSGDQWRRLEDEDGECSIESDVTAGISLHAALEKWSA